MASEGGGQEAGGRDWFKWLAVALAGGHLAAVVLAGRVRGEHVLCDLLLAALPFLGRKARLFAQAALPLWLTGLVTDNQWVFFPLRGAVNTADLAMREVIPFAPGGASCLPEWFQHNPVKVLDALAGFAYSTHIVEILLVGLLLFRLEPRRFERLAWSFLVVNLAGIAISMAYPAAPPWYVLANGTGPADLAAAGSAAGAARFDALFGINYFQAFYSRNPNVFAAVPSLHSAYPMLVVYAVWKLGWRWRAPALAFALLMGFSAIYLAHHYLFDVLTGMSLALASSLAVSRGPAWMARLRQAREAVPESGPALE